MECIERCAYLGEEFEGCLGLVLRGLHRIRILPRKYHGCFSERIVSIGAEGVPIGNGEAKVFLHGLSCHDFLRIVEFECQRIVRFRTFIIDFSNSLEILTISYKYITHGFLLEK
jgi:hypothetical protein